LNITTQQEKECNQDCDIRENTLKICVDFKNIKQAKQLKERAPRVGF